MSVDCLLIIDEDSPLNFALDVLLTPSSGITAVKSEARNFQGLMNEICDLNSRVVILEDTATGAGDGTFAQMLMSNPDLKIIVVLRESNYIHVFRKVEMLIQSSTEFLDVIRSV